jgi:hypothetical protein
MGLKRLVSHYLLSLIQQISHMKKYYFFLAFSLFALANAQAQITVGQAQMPQAGDTIRLSTTTNQAGLPTFSSTGVNYTWDYSMLTPMSQTIDTFLSVTSTPLAYQLFFNDIVFYPAYVATVAQAAANPPAIGTVTITAVDNYYKDGATAYEGVGYGANINAVPTSVKDDSIDYIYRFPMNYGNADSSNSVNHVNIPLLGYYGTRQKRVNHVDGWGTVKTPFGTFQALRVTTKIYATDSLYITALTFGFSLPLPQQLQYKWFVLSQHVPVLQINENVIANNPVLTSIVYRDSARKIVNGIAQINSQMEGVKLFPNPAKNTVYLQSQSAINGLEISMYNVLGETIMQKHIAKLETGELLPIDISGLSSGIYFIRAYTGTGAITFKLSKE